MAQICADHVPNIGRKSPSILLFSLFWHLILAILAAFLPPLLFLTHLRGVVTDIMVGDWHMVTLCAWRPFKLSNFGTCPLVPLQPRPSFWAPVHQQELHPNPPPPILQGRPASSCCSTCVFGHVLSIWSIWAHMRPHIPMVPCGYVPVLYLDLILPFNATYATRILNEHSYISIHAILLIVKFHTCHPYMPFCAPLGCHMAMKAWKVGHDVGCPRTPRTQLSYGPATGCFGSDDRDISWLYQFTMGASLHNNLDFNWLHAPAAQPDGTVPAEWIWENQRTCNIRAT